MTWETEVAADSPLFLWTPDGVPNGTTTDESGNVRSIETHTFAEVPYGAWMDVNTAFSIEAWIKTTSTGVNQIAAREGAAPRVFQFRTNNGNAEFVKLAGGTTSCVVAASINNGLDRHIIATYDGANSRVYVDSTLGATTAGTGNLVGGTKPLTIGVRYNTSITALADMFFGEIKGLVYYGTVLNSTRITAHYAAGVPSGVPAGTLDGVWGMVG